MVVPMVVRVVVIVLVEIVMLVHWAPQD